MTDSRAFSDPVAFSDRLWRGEVTTDEYHPWDTRTDAVEIADGVAFIGSFANVTAIERDGDLVMVDTGGLATARKVYEQVRAWTASPLRTAIYSHGHIDHVLGTRLFEEESATNGWAAPRVVAHEHLPRRFDRYIETAGYNGAINARQFNVPGLQWPTEYRYPDETYKDSMTVALADLEIELHHAHGETDDHTWTWVPEHKLASVGDLFIWASPNAGNPQKVQRFPREWAAALRDIASREPELLTSGHGVPIFGKDRIVTALTDTAEYLDHLCDATIDLMNQGARLDDILHTVTVPAHLADKPYLQPVYDEPEFIVRNVWRLYGGWYDGNPATLKPSPDAELATAIAELSGGAGVLAERARELSAAGDHRLASHLVEFAGLAAPDDPGVHRIRADVFRTRAEYERSTMARGVYNAAARDSDAIGNKPA